jgi:hypothetical protein
MSEHISPEDLDVAAGLAAAAELPATAAAEPTADISDITAVLSDIVKSVPTQNDEQLAKSIQLAQNTADAIVRLEKSIADIAQALTKLTAAPAASAAAPIVKSVTTVDPSPLDSTAKVEEQLTKSVVLGRALDALTKTDDLSKQVELRSAIARLESNFSPAQIAAELRLI